MYLIKLISILIFVAFLYSCDDKPVGGNNDDQNNFTSIEQAFEIVKSNFINSDSIIAIYSLNEKIQAGSYVPVDGYATDTPQVDYESWFFFVDLDYPRASWPRDCEYVFVDWRSDRISSFSEGYPPQNFTELELKFPVRNSTQILSRMEAFDLLMSQYLGSDPRSLILAANKILDIEDTIYVNGSDKYYNPGSANWFFFIDDHYIISDIYPRSCHYAFVNSLTGFIQVTFDTRPPTDLIELDTVYHKWHLQNYDKPELTFSDSCVQFGCSNIRVYIENEHQNAIVKIEADRSELSLNPLITEFNLIPANSYLKVEVDFYYYLPENYQSMAYRYCNDVISYVRPPGKWIAKSGIIRIAVSEHDRATIELENVEFYDENTEISVILEYLLLSDIMVGWYPG